MRRHFEALGWSFSCFKCLQALQMMGEGYSDFQDLFAANPPPGGFYDPFTVTGEGTYVAPEVKIFLQSCRRDEVAPLAVPSFN